MKFQKTIICIIIFFSLLLSEEFSAVNHNVFYLGFRSADKSNPNKTDSSPYTLGYMSYQESFNAYFGIEYAGEGTMLSSTYGRDDAIEQGDSWNLIFSKPINPFDINSTIGFIIGVANVREYCSNGDSYLGYACYADASPDYDREVNFGGLFTLSNELLTFGIRLTSKSSQAIVGYNF